MYVYQSIYNAHRAIKNRACESQKELIVVDQKMCAVANLDGCSPHPNASLVGPLPISPMFAKSNLTPEQPKVQPTDNEACNTLPL